MDPLFRNLKAIIPIAGLGTRLLPLTKVIPKAMLPVAGKPCVQWIIEELSVAGVTDVIFVYSKGQEMVREYFAEKTWYDEELARRGKIEEAKKLEAIRNLAKFQFVEQKDLLGDGHAILQARTMISQDEPFLVILGDCLYHGDQPVKKLVDAHEETGSSIVAVQKIPAVEAKNYGIAEIKDNTITALIEKPSYPYKQANSYNLALIGRYLLTPEIWPHLELCLKKSGEARLIDALQSLIQQEPVLAVELSGVWLDSGTQEGLAQANSVLGSF